VKNFKPSTFTKFVFSVLALALSGCSTTKHVTEGDVAANDTESTLIAYQSAPSNYKKGTLVKECEESMTKAEGALKSIASRGASERNFANTQLAFELALSELSDETAGLTFMKYVTPNSQLREDSGACEEKLSQYLVEVFTRPQLYAALKAVVPGKEEEKVLHKEMLLAFEENGLKLPQEKLDQVRELMKEMSSKSNEFSKNLNNDTSFVLLSAEELKGLPESVMSRLEKRDGKLVVTMKYADFIPAMENVEDEQIRKKLIETYNTRAAVENTKLLEENLLLRQKTAKILGFKSWADYRLQKRMAKNTKNVWNMINGLKSKLSIRNQKDLNLLLEEKRKHTTNPKAKLEPWDLAFYVNRIKRQTYSIDDEVVRSYFPKDVVVEGIFEIYSTLLGVEFEKVKGAAVWSSLVDLYRIKDKESKSTIAYFMADLYPREGKYGHAAAFTLINGRLLDGVYNKPVSAMVTNFTPPSKDRPSLLSHDEVETFFHEFGHIMHQTLTRAPYASLSGTSVARDFVEAPSQMLEDWVWDKQMLKKISRHYKTGESLPDDLIERMLQGRDFNRGYHYTRQLMLGTLDMTLHTASGAVDSRKVHDQLYKEIIGLDPIKGGAFSAGFGHLMGGYDAGYYGYIWSEVYAADMFTRFEKAGLLDSKTGLSYRKNILEPGKMKDALALATEFLGRVPNQKAFFKKLGIRQ